MRRPLYLSPAVVAMLSLRMDAAHGTPTIWEKLEALAGIGTDHAATLAGEKADFTSSEQAVLVLFRPLLHNAEDFAITDLVTFITKVLASLAQPPSTINGAMGIVQTALTSEAGVAEAQAVSIGTTSLTTLVTAALASLGHLNVPVA